MCFGLSLAVHAAAGSFISGDPKGTVPAGPVRTLAVRLIADNAHELTLTRELLTAPATSVNAKRRSAASHDLPAPTFYAPVVAAPDDDKPRLLVPPEIGEATLFSSQRGDLVAEVFVDIAGDVTDVRVLRSDLPDSDSVSVIKAIGSAKYSPARHRGQPVNGQSTLYFEYRPDESPELRYDWISDYLLNSG